jgi:glycosyltransferase involved in cell wall biosynthesis
VNISVVVPTVGRSYASLQRAVESVPADDDRLAFEIIVVDDHSAHGIDGSALDGRACLVRRRANGGVAAAQNSGLDIANGECVVFLHDDDLLAADRFAPQVSELQGDGRVGWVGSGSAEAGTIRDDPLSGATARDMLARPLGVHVSNYLFRRDVLLRYRFDENLRCREDWDLLYRLKRDDVPFHSIDVVGSIRPGSAPDRLSNSIKMAHSLAYLRSKFYADLSAERRLLANWEFRMAMIYGRFAATDDDLREARRWLLSSLRLAPLHPGRAAIAARSVFKRPERKA